MQLFTSEGIVFRTVKYSETSIICDIYTREKGLRSFIVSGARTARSSIKGVAFRPPNLVEITAYDHPEDTKLNRIKEVGFNHYYQSVNTDVVVSSVAIFMLEVCRNAIREREANTVMFDFLKAWFVRVDDKASWHPDLHLAFMVELSGLLGFGPLPDYSSDKPYFDMLEGVFCGGPGAGDNFLDERDSMLLDSLMTFNGRLPDDVTRADRNRLAARLIRYYKLHLPGFRDVLSLDVLASVL